MTRKLLLQPDDTAGCSPDGSARVGRRTAISALVVAGFVATTVTGVSSASADPGGSTIANVAVGSGITMTGLTPSFTLSGAPGQTVTGLAAVTFNVETNNPTGYSVTVISTSATMVPAVANGDSIPIGALKVRESATLPFTSLSDTTPVTVHTQGGRSADNGDNLSNDYQVRIPVVAVATYSATLNYLATAAL